MYENFNNELLLRIKIFFTILYFASKDEDGKKQFFPFESRYIWDALRQALADHIGYKFFRYFSVQHPFKTQIWDEIKNFLSKKEKDEFLDRILNLLRVKWENDEMGYGEFKGEIKDFYSQINKGMTSIISLEGEFKNTNFLSDLDDRTTERCKILGKLTRYYLNKHIKEIRKTYFW